MVISFCIYFIFSTSVVRGNAHFMLVCPVHCILNVTVNIYVLFVCFLPEKQYYSREAGL